VGGVRRTSGATPVIVRLESGHQACSATCKRDQLPSTRGVRFVPHQPLVRGEALDAERRSVGGRVRHGCGQVADVDRLEASEDLIGTMPSEVDCGPQGHLGRIGSRITVLSTSWIRRASRSSSTIGDQRTGDRRKILRGPGSPNRHRDAVDVRVSGSEHVRRQRWNGQRVGAQRPDRWGRRPRPGPCARWPRRHSARRERSARCRQRSYGR
jgi:hypothetical protein